jgi:Icc-related predicted phosphoesterase
MFGCPVYEGTGGRGEGEGIAVHSNEPALPEGAASIHRAFVERARSFVIRTAISQPKTGQGIRVVAIGDVHMRIDTPSAIFDDVRRAARSADLVLLTGDITENGRLPEVESAAAHLAGIDAPTYAVLGNHDRRSVRRKEFRRVLASSGVDLLDGESTVVALGGMRVGLVGIGGYGGGFWPDEAPDLLSTRLSQAVAVRARREAMRLEAALDALASHDTDVTIAVLHYAPTTTTLGNEPMMKHWMLGNSILGRVIDRHQVTLAVHGHAHLGNYAGVTPGGTPVRNVALPVIGRPAVIEIAPGGMVRDHGHTAHADMSLRLTGQQAHRA